MSRNHQPPLVVFTEEDISDGISLCTRSLIGRIITEKPVHVNSLQNALSGIWCNPKGFKVEEVEPKTFQSFFEAESDMERILRGSLWIFHNSWLCLQCWERNQDLSMLNFTFVPLKVQIWGLPFHCRTTKMGYRIGSCLGEVKDSAIFEENGVMWVDFQYERLPQFCYSCGLVVHEEDTCGSHTSQVEQEDRGEGNLGPWLRGSQVGRRIADNQKGNAVMFVPQ
ncbi:Zinc knuckle CX2CX4HX4C [Sesbania bispinosa]|nr:Zinc knuckle CX2CX4HX4C [Sesbania bispinosa]